MAIPIIHPKMIYKAPIMRLGTYYISNDYLRTHIISATIL